MTTGEAIRTARHTRGWSQQQLADASGLKLVTIKKLEGGRYQPKGETLRKLAGALDVTMDELAGQPPPTVEFPARALADAGLDEEEIAQLHEQWEQTPNYGRRGYRALLVRRAALEAELRDLKRRSGDLKSLVVI